MPTHTALMTAAQLLDQRDQLGRCELWQGELIQMTPAGFDHGRITMRLALRLGNHALRHDLGEVFSAETGFLLAHDPDTVLEADIAFVRKARLPNGPLPGYFDGAPDLVVEVLSPGDRASEINRKIDLWLKAGAHEVWLIDPRNRRVTVYRDPKRPTILGPGGTLQSSDLLPGLRLAVARIWT